MLNLLINDKPVQSNRSGLCAVLDQFGAKAPYVIAINGEFVSRDAYDGVELKEGDKIEVLSPIFGG